MPSDADAPVRRLSLRTYRHEDATVVECSGRLTADSTGTLKSEIRSLIPKAKRIVLDLGGLTLMDSSGLGTVVGLYVSAKAGSCDLRLVNLNKQIRELLRITNLLTVFESCGQHLMKIP